MPEQIRARMLARVPPELDTSEGSFFYDVLQAVSIELAAQGGDIAEILDEGFALTATGVYLDRKVAEQGITRKPATKATGQVTITGQPGTTIEVGTQVASDTAFYTVIEAAVIGDTAQATAIVECDEYGVIGNCPAGAIKSFPVTISGLSAVTNAAPLANGYDGEPDSELRQRYLDKVRTPPTSGNKYHYLAWVKEVTGIGDARVFPLWDGPGTVKVVILDSNKQPPGAELLQAVADHIEDVRPIGATVTVASATGVNIDIAATLTLATGYTAEQVKGYIETNIAEYLKSIAFVETYVSYAKIGSIILDTEGVLDYSGLTVNEGTSNIAIADTEVAVLGTVTIT